MNPTLLGIKMKYCENCFKTPAFILTPSTCKHNFCISCKKHFNYCSVCNVPYTQISLIQWLPADISAPEVCNKCQKSTYSICFFFDCNHIICSSHLQTIHSKILLCSICDTQSSRIAIRNTSVDYFRLQKWKMNSTWM